MQTMASKSLLSALAGLLFSLSVSAAGYQGNDGSVILRMCKGADRVRALSVMCHSYLNGYLDAAHHYGKGKTSFCLKEGDKEQMPNALVEWIGAHPESEKQPAGLVLEKVLKARFPCKGRK